MKKIFPILIFCLTAAPQSEGQSVAPQVLAAGGDYYSSSGNSLSVTIGEMTLVQTFSGPGMILTGGFQQPQTGVALPVNLLSFTARLENRQTMLQWTTAQEFHNDHFDLERSADGSSFMKFAQVKGAGNSNVPVDYQAVDPRPFSGNTFYRLKQVDQDDHYTYSAVVKVWLDAVVKWNVYPNPARDRVFIQYFSDREAVVTLSLLDAGGRLLQQKEQRVVSGGNELAIDIASLSTGLYFIRMAVGDVVIPPIAIFKSEH